MSISKKVDKRSKAYRNAHKNDKVHIPAVIAVRLTESLKGDQSLTTTIKDLQKQVDGLNKRISQLENKVG